MIRKNKDILIFQALNWVGSYFLYVSFLKAVSPEIFSKIAAGEVFFGAIGAFLMSWSLRRLEESPSLKSEINALSYRLLLLSAIIISCAIGGFNFIYIAAVVPILLTPAHLPLKFGFNKYAYWLISLKLIFALSVYMINISALKDLYVSFIYFAPTVIYGIGLYLLYLPKFADMAHLPKPHRTRRKIKKLVPFLTHVIVTVVSSAASAVLIARVVESGLS